MDVGIGLPVTVPNTTADELVDWARLAESAGFASLGTLDRITYPNYDPLLALAAAAAVTARIRLATAVLLGPARGGTVLAKQLMSLHRLAQGRLVVGLAVGARPEDYRDSPVPFARRGRRMEQLVEELRAVFAGTGPAVGPAVGDEPPPLLLGGHSPAAIARAARLATGWISGGSSAEPYQVRADRVRKAWVEAGRTEGPRLVAVHYFSLGPDAADRVAGTLGAFYAGTGPYAARAIAEALTSPPAIRAAVEEYADAGCDELILMPCASGADQIGRLRAVL